MTNPPTSSPAPASGAETPEPYYRTLHHPSCDWRMASGGDKPPCNCAELPAAPTPESPREAGTPHDSTVVRNALADPTYSPYCMRCSGLQRMRVVEPLYWRCPVCPAEHDERQCLPAAPTTEGPREELALTKIPQRVVCPFCNAAVNAPCVRADRSVMDSVYHVERAPAAIAALTSEVARLTEENKALDTEVEARRSQEIDRLIALRMSVEKMREEGEFDHRTVLLHINKAMTGATASPAGSPTETK